MLKRKISRNIATQSCKKSSLETDSSSVSAVIVSDLFATPFWKRFYDLEYILNKKLEKLKPSEMITHTYNPVEYAVETHCAYLRRYLDGPKRVLFVGMNPGANGMGQTGVPFGNINTVRFVMKLSGEVGQPNRVHPKRPVNGFSTTIEEPSGVRIWNLFQRLAGGSLDTFARQCFVHSFCPLAFFDEPGKNVTPSELKGDYKTQIRDICLKTLDEQISLVQPEIVVAIGEYVYGALKNSTHVNKLTILKIPHPSPRSLNNHNWVEKAEKWLEANDLIKYISNVT